MAYLGSEIIQSRLYVNEKPIAPPNANYKLTFPITVYDAVRRSMEDDKSTTLSQDIDKIYEMLDNKQKLIPAKPANQLVTYGGIAGNVGAVKMVESMSWDPDRWSNDRIPTEKAVGNLLIKYGLGNNQGGTPNPSNVTWASIIGKPKIYDELGDDQDGLISQKGLNNIITKFTEDLQLMDMTLGEDLNNLKEEFLKHKNDENNPHKVTVGQIGAVSKEDFKAHRDNHNNPHNVTKEQVGLGNVDNTSDKDKPILLLTQAELDKLNQKLKVLDENTGLPLTYPVIAMIRRTENLASDEVLDR